MPNNRPYLKFKSMDAGVMTADVDGVATECIFHDSIRYQIDYTDVGSPVGVISVQVCETGLDADFVDYPMTSDMITITTGDGALNGSGTIDISGVGAGKIMINIRDPFGFIRPKFTSSSGGTGDTITATSGAR